MPDSAPPAFAAPQPPDGRPWLVVCDFDGTIAPQDVTDAVLGRFALPEWEAVEAAWKAGSIGARECMAQQVALLRTDVRELDAFLDGIAIDPAFGAFVSDCRAAGIELVVVSDGLDHAIRRILARHGLGQVPVVANHLVVLPGGRYRFEPATSGTSCRAGSGTCKCAVSDARSGGRLRLLVGDGRSDFCVAGSADLVFARDTLLERCRSLGLPHRACPDFATARRLLAGIAMPAAGAARGRSRNPAVEETALHG